MSYPRNPATPEAIAIGRITLIADGSAVVTGASVRVSLDGGAFGAGGGTLSYDATSELTSYAPIQSETNGDVLRIAVYKAACMGPSATVFMDPLDLAVDMTKLGGVAQRATDLVEIVQYFIANSAGADLTTKVANGSILAQMLAGDGLIASYIRTTDAQQAIRDAITTVDGIVDTILIDTNELQTNQGNWLTAAGFATPTNITAASGISLAADQAVNITKLGGNVQRVTDLAEIAQFFIANSAEPITDYVADDSLLAKMLASNGTIANYDDVTDSLGATRDFLATVSSDVSAVDDKVVVINTNVDAILLDTGTTLDALIKDVPTVAEFNARSVASAVYATAASITAHDAKLDTVDGIVDDIKVVTVKLDTMIEAVT